MIGVIANPADQEVIREFFELFKTPWEMYRSDRKYDVLLCSSDAHFDATAKLVLVYAGRKTHFDDEQKISIGRQRRHACILSYRGCRFPLYGESIAFAQSGAGLLTDEESRECGAYCYNSAGTVFGRIGYDLFDEVRTLLTAGQPPSNAILPTLELHIALLRDLIIEAGIPLVEVPPVPYGFQFIACLTHDVDHPMICAHRWDHTMLGFLYRAVLGSLWRTIRGRMPVRDLLRNWAAAIKLPLVYFGLTRDFWREFDDLYLELERGIPSTFFVIPFKDCPGEGPNGQAPAYRAAAYRAKDIADIIRKLLAKGREVALHGIDAWADSSRGFQELEEIRRLTGRSDIGVRMHWLYLDEHSPAALERAGAAYDSTIGYNENVGYRAGTTQVFKSMKANQLLELPLHVMDTALFYPTYLDLSPAEAMKLIRQIADNAVRFGGCITINWHDRSVAPERLWGQCYRDLIGELRARGAWFATAREAVAWFRKRRSVVFEVDPRGPVVTKVRFPEVGIPGLRFRQVETRPVNGLATHHPEDYIDKPIHECSDIPVA